MGSPRLPSSATGAQYSPIHLGSGCDHPPLLEQAADSDCPTRTVSLLQWNVIWELTEVELPPIQPLYSGPGIGQLISDNTETHTRVMWPSGEAILLLVVKFCNVFKDREIKVIFIEKKKTCFTLEQRRTVVIVYKNTLRAVPNSSFDPDPTSCLTLRQGNAIYVGDVPPIIQKRCIKRCHKNNDAINCMFITKQLSW